MTSSVKKSGGKAWCGHCKRESDAVSHGAFTSCLFCGKVLKDICVMDKVPILSRSLMKKKNKLVRNVSVGFKSAAWCSDCRRGSNAIGHDFRITCLQCGKVLGQTPYLSRLKKKTKPTKDKATSKVPLRRFL